MLPELAGHTRGETNLVFLTHSISHPQEARAHAYTRTHARTHAGFQADACLPPVSYVPTVMELTGKSEACPSLESSLIQP